LIRPKENGKNGKIWDFRGDFHIQTQTKDG